MGRIEKLSDLVEQSAHLGVIGIGHTRWATHGPATEENAHPHLGAQGRVAIVHNGVIENYGTLRTALEADGVVFGSATDTEVIVQMIERHLVKHVEGARERRPVSGGGGGDDQAASGHVRARGHVPGLA